MEKKQQQLVKFNENQNSQLQTLDYLESFAIKAIEKGMTSEKDVKSVIKNLALCHSSGIDNPALALALCEDMPAEYVVRLHSIGTMYGVNSVQEASRHFDAIPDRNGKLQPSPKAEFIGAKLIEAGILISTLEYFKPIYYRISKDIVDGKAKEVFAKLQEQVKQAFNTKESDPKVAIDKLTKLYQKVYKSNLYIRDDSAYKLRHYNGLSEADIKDIEEEEAQLRKGEIITTIVGDYRTSLIGRRTINNKEIVKAICFTRSESIRMGLYYNKDGKTISNSWATKEDRMQYHRCLNKLTTIFAPDIRKNQHTSEELNMYRDVYNSKFEEQPIETTHEVVQ